MAKYNLSLMSKEFVTEALLADILSVSRATIEKWKISGKIRPSKNGQYCLENLQYFPSIKSMINSQVGKTTKYNS